jgi:DNA polymerase
MAANYGVTVEDPRKIVDGWREANPWARWLWGALETAIASAYTSPGVSYTVGRVVYIKVGADLLCRLPSGRRLVYRGIRRFTEQHEARRRVVWEYRRGNGRVRLWGGSLAENITQATAADLLRDALVRAEPLGVVGHTHDEVILEVPEDLAEGSAEALRAVMVTGPAWAEGLPIAAKVKTGRRYGK